MFVREDKKFKYGFVVPPQSDGLKLFTWDDVVQGRIPAEIRSQGMALTVGSFDGMHAGHLTLLEAVLAQKALVPGIVTFKKPYKAGTSDSYAGEVATLSQRLEICARKGIAFAVVIDFSSDFAKIEGTDFINYLVKSGMKFLAEGRDFRCGDKGACDIERLEAIAQSANFSLSVVDDVLVDGERVSSSRIREAVLQNDFALAQKMMLRPFSYDCSDLVWKKSDGAQDKCWYSAESNFVQVLPPDGTFDVVAVMSGSSENSSESLNAYKTTLTLERGNLRLLLSSDKTAVHVQALNFIPVNNVIQSNTRSK